MNDDEGMRLIRTKRKKYTSTPYSLAEVAPGQVVLVAVRVAAHLAGPGSGPATHCLCRLFATADRKELYLCGDINVARSHMVPVYTEED